MKSFVVALLALAVLCAADNDVRLFERALKAQTPKENAQNTWVVLVAGSTSYMNYRHQASVCHAYQIAHKFGVPDERIIVFMADDIAYSSSNPFQGEIYNYFYIKGGQNVNVYPGVPKDYTGENATADNLLAVLLGMEPESGSGKTLRPSAEDNVFFYYDDHGNTDIIAMPTGRRFTGSSDWKQVFDMLGSKHLYKNFVIFVQACYSGSLFYKQNIPDNVYIATSAPTDDSAYACWMDSTLRTFVTSCWPRGWIRPMDEESPDTVTFDQLFADAHKFTSNSTEPCQYGDADVKKLTMKEFFGISSTPLVSEVQTRDLKLEANAINVPQYDVPYTLALMRYKETGSESDRRALLFEQNYREKIDKIVRTAAERAVPHHGGLFRTDICTEACDASCPCFSQCTQTRPEEDCKLTCCGYTHCYATHGVEDDAIECAATLVREFDNTCGKSNHDYILSATRTFNRICRTRGHDINAAIQTFKEMC
jgi:Glycosylphosphatidylinositol transamidase (GPIT), subunit GPI8